MVAQRPQPGTKAQKGETVTIDVSKGRGRTTVPDVVGRSRADAESALADAGLVANAVTVPSSEAEGTVTAQDPAAGEQVDRGTKVRINVSSGSSSTTTTTTSPGTTTSQGASVPDLSGLEQTAAIRKLVAAGLRPRVVYAASDGPENTVTAQSPDAGASASRGSRVRITVSAGPSPSFSQVPDVVGQTTGDARSALEAEGFTVAVFRVAGQSGVVVDEQPAGGGRAPDGGQVSIFVGKG